MRFSMWPALLVIGWASVAHAQATQPAATSDATALLDSVRQAYSKLETHSVSGTLSLDLDAAGQTIANQYAFTSSFESPNRFRHEMRGDLLVVSDGKKAFVHKFDQNRYTELDAPAGREGDAPAMMLRQILAEQNPSLLLALSKDPAETLAARGATTALKDDSTLTIADEERDTTYTFDAKTRLISRVEVDLAKSLRRHGVPSVNRARYTIEYGGAVADAGAVAYAWTPPDDAIRVAPTQAASESFDGPAGAEQAMVGQPAPDFTLKDLAGADVSLADLKGNVVLLDFWATWCGPCRMALPHLNQLHKDLAEAGVKLFAVDLKEDPATVRKFITQNNYSLSVLLDSDGKVAASYRVSGIPHTVIIGKDGKVRKVTVGYSPGSEEGLRQSLIAAARE